MTKRIFLLVATLAIATILAGCTAPNDDDDREVVRIVGSDADGYDPADLEITAGTTVLWRNMDNQAHTATADDESWDSGNIAPGETWEHTFDEPGEYPYHCMYHGPQTGTITVTEADDAGDAEE